MKKAATSVPADAPAITGDLLPDWTALPELPAEPCRLVIVRHPNYELDRAGIRYLTGDAYEQVDGKYHGHTYFYPMARVLNETPGGVQKLSSNGLGTAIQGGDDQWQIFTRIDGQKYLAHEGLQTALAGAAEIQIAGKFADYALLPATTVSRSGLWELDELIADRAALAR